ncbi:MAG: VTT domain-containing protein [Anaerolineae bacterium]|nr:VTT domain-containing protein [Anaerolineae bacterium]
MKSSNSSSEAAAPKEDQGRAPSFWRRYQSQILALSFSVAITASVVIFRDQLLALRGYGYLGVFFIAVLGNATVFFPVPGLAAVFAGGSVLNPTLVGLIAGVGEPLGELSGYLAGYGGSAVVEDRLRYERLRGWMERRGFLTIFVLSAIPNPIFDLAGVTAGILRFPISRFLLACWLGKTLKAFVVAYLGSVSLPWLLDLIGRS